MEIRWLTMILPARYPSAFEFEHARHASPPVSAAHAMRRAAMMEYVTPRPDLETVYRIKRVQFSKLDQKLLSNIAKVA
ncbi:hypothetical protein AAMO2058_001739200 [Amorphochlora amoebiformis]